MYRERIRDYYGHLSRSYRRVAEFVLSDYFEVSFMTAAQLAKAVDVDTTTVVRFSQRLGYDGYPELLQDIREQVRSEVYGVYRPASLPSDDPAAAFKQSTLKEQHYLNQMLVHNPPDHVRKAVQMISDASEIVVIAEGYADPVAELAAQQMRRRGMSAQSVSGDAAKLAATLAGLGSNTLVMGISPTLRGEMVGRALEYARSQGHSTLGVVGSLESPVNRLSDVVVYAPNDETEPLPSLVSIATAMAGLIDAAGENSPAVLHRTRSTFDQAYHFLTQTETIEPDDESGLRTR
jgi:DNA-binding MurR/RpiR family transcriptional regulator